MDVLSQAKYEDMTEEQKMLIDTVDTAILLLSKPYKW